MIGIRFGGTELEAFIEWEENVRDSERCQKTFWLILDFQPGAYTHRAGKNYTSGAPSD